MPIKPKVRLRHGHIPYQELFPLLIAEVVLRHGGELLAIALAVAIALWIAVRLEWS